MEFWKGYPHVIRSQQFSREQLERLFVLTKILKGKIHKGERADWLHDSVIATLFYEPSTRTRLSFEAAAQRLGAQVISTENAAEFSSAVKGETLEDTIRIVSAYADLIVMRHKETGAAARAVKTANSARRKTQQPVTAIINGGDGKGQHPTQALLDVYTILEHFGHIDGLRVAMVGDLQRGRTVRSLAYMLSKFDGVKFYFVAPPVARIEPDILQHLDKHGLKYHQTENFASVIQKVDLVYMLRYQLEREEDEEKKRQLRRAMLTHVMNRQAANSMKENSIILHPLPRVKEIGRSVDNNPRAKYFVQAANGLYIRMALLLTILQPNFARSIANGDDYPLCYQL